MLLNSVPWMLQSSLSALGYLVAKNGDEEVMMFVAIV